MCLSFFFVHSSFFRFSHTHCLHMFGMEILIKCAQHAHTVFSSLKAVTIHYAHTVNTSEGKLFLEVLRTWKQLRYKSMAAAATKITTHTQEFDSFSFVFILVWCAEQKVKYLYFDDWSLHVTVEKKTNRIWNEWVPLKSKP